MTPVVQVVNCAVTPAVAVVQATGGTETTVGGYKYHTFASSGTLTVSSGGSVEYCIVAGGGSGGRGNGGSGGGAGGMLTGTASLSAQSYTITVGAGGADRTGSNSIGNNGQNSTFAGSGFTTLTAIGAVAVLDSTDQTERLEVAEAAHRGTILLSASAAAERLVKVTTVAAVRRLA